MTIAQNVHQGGMVASRRQLLEAMRKQASPHCFTEEHIPHWAYGDAESTSRYMPVDAS